MSKIYLVQTWDTEGALKNNYEVSLDTDSELANLRKFLRTKYSHVVLTRKLDPKPAAKRARA